MMAHEVLENAVLVSGELQRIAIHLRLLAIEVQQQRARLDGGLNETRRAPQQGIEPGFQLLELERLDHVVVGAGGQAFDLVLPVPPCGEHQDGKALALCAQLPDQVEAAHARQAQVDDGQVVVVFGDLVQGFLGIGHGIHHVAVLAQTGEEMVAQQRLVFHNQQFHPTFLPVMTRPGKCPADGCNLIRTCSWRPRRPANCCAGPRSPAAARRAPPYRC
ncbi:hypothetical protein D3C84_638020 [compost metagenome]